MDVRFYIDPETEQPHIYDYGVTEEEVRQVLAAPGEDRAGPEESRIALGQTAAGRYLRVIYSRDRIGAGVFVITAFELTGKPLRAYRCRQRSRGRRRKRP